MSNLDFYNDLNLQNTLQLLGARLHNVTTAARTALSASLGAANTGLTVWDTDLNKQYHWNGTAWQADTIEVPGAAVVQTIAINPTNAATVAREPGYIYFVDAPGELVAAGVTFAPDATVEIGDMVTFISETYAVVTQTNLDLAPVFAAQAAKDQEQDDRLSGVEGRATALEGEVDALQAEQLVQDGRIAAAEGRLTAVEGEVDALQAEQLVQDGRIAAAEGRLDVVEADILAIEGEQVAQNGRLTSLEADRQKAHFETITLVPNVPKTVTHNLGLVDKDAFNVKMAVAGKVSFGFVVTSVDANSLTVTSQIPVTAAIYIDGKAA